MKLENWYIIGNCCFGEVYGNPKFEDGTFVRTSTIKEYNKERSILQTKNSTYELGTENIE